MIYLFLIPAYFFIAAGIISLVYHEDLNIIFATIIVGFSILNTLLCYFLSKMKFVYSIICGIIIAILSVTISKWIGRSVHFPNFDPWGITTAVISHSFLSILFLDLARRIIKK